MLKGIVLLLIVTLNGTLMIANYLLIQLKDVNNKMSSQDYALDDGMGGKHQHRNLN